MIFDQALREQVVDRLQRFERRAMSPDGRRAAAVAITLLPRDSHVDHSGSVDHDASEACFILTRRAASLRKHARQWALPGGRLDPGETAERAALRELHEEVGLALGEDAVLGVLDDYGTRSGFIITPVVVWAGDHAELKANPDEVAHIYRVPLMDLDVPDAPRLVSIPESDRPVIQMPLLSTLVHAPTAAVLYQAREVLVHGRATRVDHFEQPVWAW